MLVQGADVAVRRAKPSDLEEICRIEDECFGDDAFPQLYMRSFLEADFFITLVVLLGDKIVGYVVGAIETFRDKDAGHIYSIGVKPEYRGMGIGSRLLEAIERELKEAGAEICYLEVGVNNTAAINLYLKHNYRPLERLKNYYGFGRDGMRMIKKLSDR